VVVGRRGVFPLQLHQPFLHVVVAAAGLTHLATKNNHKTLKMFVVFFNF